MSASRTVRTPPRRRATPRTIGAVVAGLAVPLAIAACRSEPEFSLAGSWVDEQTRGRGNFARYEAGGAAVSASPQFGLYESGTFVLGPRGDGSGDYVVRTTTQRGGKTVVDSAVLRVVDTAHVRMAWFQAGQPAPDVGATAIALVRVSDAEGARIEEGARRAALEKFGRERNGGW